MDAPQTLEHTHHMVLHELFPAQSHSHSQEPWEGEIAVLSILQGRKLNPGKEKQFAQGSNAGKAAPGAPVLIRALL